MPRHDGVRCQHCGKLLAEALSGELRIVCRGCKTRQVIRQRDEMTVEIRIVAESHEQEAPRGDQ